MRDGPHLLTASVRPRRTFTMGIFRIFINKRVGDHHHWILWCGGPPVGISRAECRFASIFCPKGVFQMRITLQLVITMLFLSAIALWPMAGDSGNTKGISQTCLRPVA